MREKSVADPVHLRGETENLIPFSARIIKAANMLFPFPCRSPSSLPFSPFSLPPSPRLPASPVPMQSNYSLLDAPTGKCR